MLLCLTIINHPFLYIQSKCKTTCSQLASCLPGLPFDHEHGGNASELLLGYAMSCSKRAAVTSFLLLACLAYSSNLKMQAVCSPSCWSRVISTWLLIMAAVHVGLWYIKWHWTTYFIEVHSINNHPTSTPYSSNSSTVKGKVVPLRHHEGVWLVDV
jgi:hypothetical protein